MEKDLVFLEDSEISEIIQLLLVKFNVDFSNYTKTSLGRRLARFYSIYFLNNTNDLLRFLNRSSENFKLFINEITVNTTEMYRDPEFWKYLRTELLPTLQEFDSLRIWHAGCSTGEEVVSMIILLKELELLHKVKLVATDINTEVLDKTKSYEFKTKDLGAFSKNYIEMGGGYQFVEYFNIKDDKFNLKEEFRPTNILFKLHNLATDVAFSKFDLILCRNVMIYFDEALQSRTLKIFKESLFKKSFLAIGRKENITFLAEGKDLNCINNKEKVYQLRSN